MRAHAVFARRESVGYKAAVCAESAEGGASETAMRIIGGTLGGRRLRAVEGRKTRPTTDRVREALFSRLDARYGLEGAVVLDLFSGTGALAIEALSRGAARAVCVESDRRALEVLRGNLRELALAPRVRLVGEDFARALAALERDGARFDGIFLDPPYAKGLAADALAAIAAHALLAPGGWIAAEASRRDELPERVASGSGDLVRVREDVYGDTVLALYELGRRANEEPGSSPEVER